MKKTTKRKARRIRRAPRRSAIPLSRIEAAFRAYIRHQGDFNADVAWAQFVKELA